MKRLLIPIVLAVFLMSGCETLGIFQDQDAKDAVLAQIEGQIEDIKEFVDQTPVLTVQQRDTLLADIALLMEQHKEDAARPTVGEALTTVGDALTSALPPPFNLLGGMVLTALMGGEGMRRRKNGQMGNIVESFVMAGKSDGNGNIIVDKKALGEAQREMNVQGMVDSLRKSIEQKNVKI